MYFAGTSSKEKQQSKAIASIGSKIKSLTKKLTEKAAAQSSSSNDLDLLQAYKAIVKPDIAATQSSRSSKAEKRDIDSEADVRSTASVQPKRARLSTNSADTQSPAKWSQYFVGRATAELNTSSDTIDNTLDTTDASMCSEPEESADTKKRSASSSLSSEHEQDSMPHLVAITPPTDKSRSDASHPESTELSPPSIDKEGDSKGASTRKQDDAVTSSGTRRSSRRVVTRRSLANASNVDDETNEDASSSGKRHSARVRQPTAKATAMARARQEFEKTQVTLSKKSLLPPADEKLLKEDATSESQMSETTLTLKRDAQIKVRTYTHT